RERGCEVDRQDLRPPPRSAIEPAGPVRDVVRAVVRLISPAHTQPLPGIEILIDLNVDLFAIDQFRTRSGGARRTTSRLQIPVPRQIQAVYCCSAGRK